MSKNRLRRMLTIWTTLMRASLQAELQYRAGFLAKIVRGAFWAVFVLASLLVIYGRTNNVAGWNEREAIALAGTFFLVAGVNHLFFNGLAEIPEHVRLGTLDHFLVKPVDAQFWVSVRKLNISELGSFLTGLGLLVYGISGHGPISALSWIAYAIGLVMGTAMYYSLNLAFMTLAVWFVRVDNLWVLTETITTVSRYPLEVFGRGLRWLFLTGVPLGLFAYGPTLQLVRGFDPVLLATSVAWGLAAATLSRLLWTRATRSYTSASS